jgi:integrase
MATGTDDAPTVASYLNRWLAHMKGRVRARTWEGYEYLVRLHALPRLGEIAITDLGPLDLQDLYAELTADPDKHLSPGTVLNLHLVLHQALAQAVRWGMLMTNPADGAQPPRARRPERLAVDERLAATILERLHGHPIELPVAIAIATGMRRGEILGLRWSDVADDLSALHVRRTLQPTADGLVFEDPKTPRSRRTVALPGFLHPYLDRQRQDQAQREAEAGPRWQGTGLVVDGADGLPFHPYSLSGYWRRFLVKEGLPHLRFHDLRHAHATLMLLQGVHPKVVSERLGHASVGITLDTYSHVLPAMQSEAVAAFDALFT